MFCLPGLSNLGAWMFKSSTIILDVSLSLLQLCNWTHECINYCVILLIRHLKVIRKWIKIYYLNCPWSWAYLKRVFFVVLFFCFFLLMTLSSYKQICDLKDEKRKKHLKFPAEALRAGSGVSILGELSWEWGPRRCPVAGWPEWYFASSNVWDGTCVFLWLDGIDFFYMWPIKSALKPAFMLKLSVQIASFLLSSEVLSFKFESP